jgi:hypothetical protein
MPAKAGFSGATKMQELAGSGSPPATAASPASSSQNWPPPAPGAGPAIAVQGDPVAPACQPVFAFENRAAGNCRRLGQLAEKRGRHRIGGEFPVPVAVAGRVKHLPLGRHVPGAGIPAVAQRKPPDARLPGDDRPIGRIGVGVMHRAVAEFVLPEHAATGDDHLERIGLVEVRPGYRARPLLDQEGHRVQRIVGRRVLARRQGVAVGADIGGVPAGRRLASACAPGEDAVGAAEPGPSPYQL